MYEFLVIYLLDPPISMKVAAEAQTPSAMVRTRTRFRRVLMQSMALRPAWRSPPSLRMKMRISGRCLIPSSRYLCRSSSSSFFNFIFNSRTVVSQTSQ